MRKNLTDAEKKFLYDGLPRNETVHVVSVPIDRLIALFDDRDACIKAHDENVTLLKHFQDIMKQAEKELVRTETNIEAIEQNVMMLKGKILRLESALMIAKRQRDMYANGCRSADEELQENAEIELALKPFVLEKNDHDRD